MPATEAMSSDLAHMRHALALAERALGTTAPNPAVGCVIVKDERVVGRGWTQPGGRPHAEVVALAEESGRSGARGDGVCDAGAVRASGRDAALCACAGAGGCRARGQCGGRSRSARQRQGHRDAVGWRREGDDGRSRKRRRCPQCRIFSARDEEPSAGDAQGCAEHRWQDRNGLRPEQMDHRARGAALPGICCASETRCDPGRDRNRALPTIPNSPLPHHWA